MLGNWLSIWGALANANLAAWLPRPADTSDKVPCTHKHSLPYTAHGTVIFREFVFEGARMRYRLYVPHCYKNHDRPLIVMLHGCRQTADDFACVTQMNNLADE